MTDEEKKLQKEKLSFCRKQIGAMLKKNREIQGVSTYKLIRDKNLSQSNYKRIEDGKPTTINIFLKYLNGTNAFFYIPDKPLGEVPSNYQAYAKLLKERNTPPMEREKLGVFLKKRRKEKKITEVDIANKGLHYKQITSIEKGNANYQLDSLLMYLEAISCYFIIEKKDSE